VNDGTAARSRQAGAVGRYLERPYASVQLLLLAGGGLLGFGVLMAASTTISAANDQGGAIWTQLIREIEFVVIGVPIFWFAIRASPRRFRTLAYPTMFIALVLLFAVLVPGIGVGVYGARRWIDLGPIQLQPSEVAKLAILLWAADLLIRKQHLKTLDRAVHVFVPLIPVFVLVCVLVMLEPDLGTTMCFLLVLLGLLWTLGLPMRYFAGVLLAVGGVVTLLAVVEPYRLKRLLTFVHPFQEHRGAGYQTVEGLYALASGGVFGVGLGNGTSKYEWVPNANTDYVFSVIGEELGLLGCVAVLGFFALFAYTGLRITRRNADPFVRLAAGGATVWICGQGLINIGYVTALLPVTGIPLPFISAGGTSLLVTVLVFGMLVSFARHEPDAVAAAQRAAAARSRSRIERWLRVPLPKPYVPPKPPSKPKPRPVAAERAQPAPAERVQKTRFERTQQARTEYAQLGRAERTQPARTERTQPRVNRAQPARATRAQPARAARVQPTRGTRAEPDRAIRVQPTRAARAQPTRATRARSAEASRVQPPARSRLPPAMHVQGADPMTPMRRPPPAPPADSNAYRSTRGTQRRRA
jgi:cell division protein FtsW